jgi:CBS domain-containing protein
MPYKRRMEGLVSEYVRVGVLTVAAAADLAEADAMMARHGVSDLLVVDHGDGTRPVGVISRSDLLRVGRIHARAVARPAVLTLPQRPVGEVMTHGVVTVPLAATLRDAARLIVDKKVHRLFVADGEAVVGVLSARELQLAIIDARIETPLQAFMISPPVFVDAASPLWVAADLLARGAPGGAVVMEGGYPVGLFGQDDALAARDVPGETPVGEVMSHALVSLPADLPLHRAAALAAETHARCVLALEGEEVKGLLSGLEFARAVLQEG